jgi:hypothetical protein
MAIKHTHVPVLARSDDEMHQTSVYFLTFNLLQHGSIRNIVGLSTPKP